MDIVQFVISLALLGTSFFVIYEFKRVDVATYIVGLVILVNVV